MQQPALPALRILLIKTSSLGDVIHNLPVVSDIQRMLPQAVIDWVVEESFAEIPRLNPGVARVIPVAMRRWRNSLMGMNTWREFLAFRRAVRAEAYAAVIDTQGLVKSALLALLARGRRFGHATPRERLAALGYDLAIEIPREQHAVLRNRQLAAAALGYSLADLPLDYGIAHSPALSLLPPDWLPARDYAVLLTATSRADKTWPEANWRALGQALVADGLFLVLPGGNTKERERAARLAGSLGQAIAAPPLDLTALAGLLAGARLIVGVDTGLTHLAAALGRPTLALFCASDPALTGVLSKTPHRNLGTIGKPPHAAKVIAAAQELLR